MSNLTRQMGTPTIEEDARICELAKLVICECCNPDIQEELLDGHVSSIALNQHSVIQGEKRSEESHLKCLLILRNTEAGVRICNSSALYLCFLDRVSAQGVPKNDISVPDICHDLLDLSLAEELLGIGNSCYFKSIKPLERFSDVIAVSHSAEFVGACIRFGRRRGRKEVLLRRTKCCVRRIRVLSEQR